MNKKIKEIDNKLNFLEDDYLESRKKLEDERRKTLEDILKIRVGDSVQITSLEIRHQFRDSDLESLGLKGKVIEILGKDFINISIKGRFSHCVSIDSITKL